MTILKEWGRDVPVREIRRRLRELRKDCTSHMARGEMQHKLAGCRVQVIDLEDQLGLARQNIVEADAAYNLDRQPLPYEEARLGLVRMSHEGRAALDREQELEHELKQCQEDRNELACLLDEAIESRDWYKRQLDEYQEMTAAAEAREQAVMRLCLPHDEDGRLREAMDAWLCDRHAALDAALSDHGVDVLAAATRIVAALPAESWDHELLTEAENDALGQLISAHWLALAQARVNRRTWGEGSNA